VDLDGDAIADLELVDVRSKLDDRSNVLVSRREVFVEWQAALDQRGRSLGYDADVSITKGDGIDPDQSLAGTGLRNRLLRQPELARIVQHPGAHGRGNLELTVHSHDPLCLRCLTVLGSHQPNERRWRGQSLLSNGIGRAKTEDRDCGCKHSAVRRTCSAADANKRALRNLLDNVVNYGKSGNARLRRAPKAIGVVTW
jgi:hypothetical protein